MHTRLMQFSEAETKRKKHCAFDCISRKDSALLTGNMPIRIPPDNANQRLDTTCCESPPANSRAYDFKSGAMILLQEECSHRQTTLRQRMIVTLVSFNQRWCDSSGRSAIDCYYTHFCCFSGMCFWIRDCLIHLRELPPPPDNALPTLLWEAALVGSQAFDFELGLVLLLSQSCQRLLRLLFILFSCCDYDSRYYYCKH